MAMPYRNSNSTQSSLVIIFPYLLVVTFTLLYGFTPLLVKPELTTNWLLDPFARLHYPIKVLLSGVFMLLSLFIDSSTIQGNGFLSEQRTARALTLAVLLLSCIPTVWQNLALVFSLFVLSVAYRYLFLLYKQPQSPYDSASAGAIVGIATLLSPPLFPIFILGLIHLRFVKAASLRNVLAYIMGYLAPIMAIMPVLLHYNTISASLYQLRQFFSFAPIWQYDFSQYAVFYILGIGYLFLVLLIVFAAILRTPYRGEKEATTLNALLCPLIVLLGGLFSVQYILSYIAFSSVALGVLFAYGTDKKNSSLIVCVYLLLLLGLSIVLFTN